jgi:hypothetical protein
VVQARVAIAAGSSTDQKDLFVTHTTATHDSKTPSRLAGGGRVREGGEEPRGVASQLWCATTASCAAYGARIELFRDEIFELPTSRQIPTVDLTGRCIKSHCVSTWDRDYTAILI